MDDWVFDNKDKINETFNDKLCGYFYSVGNLKLLKYTNEKGYGWYRWTCINAAENGHLDCLKYAYENGCLLDSLIIKYASENRYLNCLKFLFYFYIITTNYI